MSKGKAYIRILHAPKPLPDGPIRLNPYHNVTHDILVEQLNEAASKDVRALRAFVCKLKRIGAQIAQAPLPVGGVFEQAKAAAALRYAHIMAERLLALSVRYAHIMGERLQATSLESTSEKPLQKRPDQLQRRPKVEIAPAVATFEERMFVRRARPGGTDDDGTPMFPRTRCKPVKPDNENEPWVLAAKNTAYQPDARGARLNSARI